VPSGGDVVPVGFLVPVGVGDASARLGVALGLAAGDALRVALPRGVAVAVAVALRSVTGMVALGLAVAERDGVGGDCPVAVALADALGAALVGVTVAVAGSAVAAATMSAAETRPSRL
jgi:hypothetical protein